MRNALLVVLAVAAAVAAPAAVLSATDGQEAPRSPEQVYETRCAYCHDTGGWGTRSLARRMPADQALLLQRKDMPPAYTEFVVRRGFLSMPAFNPSELTDTELAALAQWLEERN